MDGHKHSHPSEPPSSTQGSRGGWFRAPDCVPIQIARGGRWRSSGRNGRVAVFIMSIASSSKTKPGNAPRPGGKESRGLWASSGRLVLSLALYGGVPIERVGWMDGLEVLEVYLWVLAIVVHRAFFFYRGYWP